MAALCHFYPGYTMQSLRDCALPDYIALVDGMAAATKKRKG